MKLQEQGFEPPYVIEVVTEPPGLIPEHTWWPGEPMTISPTVPCTVIALQVWSGAEPRTMIGHLHISRVIKSGDDLTWGGSV